MLSLEAAPNDFTSLSPMLELGAYEALWARDKMSFKRLGDIVRENPSLRLEDLVPPSEAKEFARLAVNLLASHCLADFRVRMRNDGSYPNKLLDAENPLPLLYYMGNWDFVFSRSVAVVGTRSPSAEAGARARKLTRCLVNDGFTVVSGLAQGIDTEAHQAAIAAGGRTIAVIGTSISEAYPRANEPLQQTIAKNHLVISQVPIVRYSRQGPNTNRFFFPERNITMSALTEATIIVEAGETSGTLVQARAALKQGRKLFILDSCFRNSNLKWPLKFLERGAVRVAEYGQIKELLASTYEVDAGRCLN